MTESNSDEWVLIVDDEPFHLRWLVENFEDQGYRVIVSKSAQDAIQILGNRSARVVIVDLNIPVVGPVADEVKSRGELFYRFPGLYVAHYARNNGYRNRQVIIYSAHREGGVREQADALGCIYLVKGPARQLQAEIDDVLSYDPTKG